VKWVKEKWSWPWWWGTGYPKCRGGDGRKGRGREWLGKEEGKPWHGE